MQEFKGSTNALGTVIPIEGCIFRSAALSVCARGSRPLEVTKRYVLCRLNIRMSGAHRTIWTECMRMSKAHAIKQYSPGRDASFLHLANPSLRLLSVRCGSSSMGSPDASGGPSGNAGVTEQGALTLRPELVLPDPCLSLLLRDRLRGKRTLPEPWPWSD